MKVSSKKKKLRRSPKKRGDFLMATAPYAWRVTGYIPQSKPYTSDREYEEKQRLLRQKHPFPVVGPIAFQRSVERVLDELLQHVPRRYEEVLMYLPKAEYDTSLVYAAAAISSGLFAIDGSGRSIFFYTVEQRKITVKNTYAYFLYVFLHETGHNVEYYRHRDQSEFAATRYANQVLCEMGKPPLYQ
jgi:hypothetical protein